MKSLRLASARAAMPGRSYGTYVAVITLGGAALRLAFLGSSPLWRDEAFTALAVRQSLGPMLHVVAHDSAPPLSYVLQHLIFSVWNRTAGLRLLSALAGTAAIPIGAALGRRIGGNRVGVWCALIFAVFPSLVLESRDARSYALATTMVLAATLAVWRLVEHPTRGRTIVFGLCTTAALYTNYFALFAAVGQLIAIVLVFHVDRRRLLLAGAAVATAMLLLVPWLIYAHAQLNHGSEPFWVAGVGFSTLSGVIVQFFGGPSIDAGISGALTLQTLQGVAVVIGAVGVMSLLARRHRLAEPTRRSCAFLALCSLGALSLLVLISAWHPLVEARYASVIWGPLVCLVAVGFSEVARPAIAPLGILVMAVIATVLSFALTEPDTPALTQVINGHVGPHDLVITSPAAYLLVLEYGDAAVRRQTHIVSNDVPWYWGTALFPRDAVLKRYPSPDGHLGTIYYIDVPGQPAARQPPKVERLLKPRRCYGTICLSTYARSATADR